MPQITINVSSKSTARTLGYLIDEADEKGARVDLPLLQGTSTTVAPHVMKTVEISSGNPQVLRATGLMTCAAVIFVSSDAKALARAVVYHANSGHVTTETIAAALKELGSPPISSLMVMYAIARAWDSDYDKTIALMVKAGILAKNIVWAANLSTISQFGVNNSGQLGF
jgi:hypothetical protein